MSTKTSPAQKDNQARQGLYIPPQDELPRGNGSGDACWHARYPRPERAQARFPEALEHPDQRGGPRRGYHLQPAYRQARKGKNWPEPQNALGTGDPEAGNFQADHGNCEEVENIVN